MIKGDVTQTSIRPSSLIWCYSNNYTWMYLKKIFHDLHWCSFGVLTKLNIDLQSMPIKLHQVLGDDLKLARRSTSKRQRIDLLVSATLLWRCRPHVICWSCFLLPQSRDTSWANFRKDELKVLTTKKFRVNLFRCLLPFSWYFLFINPYTVDFCFSESIWKVKVTDCCLRQYGT